MPVRINAARAIGRIRLDSAALGVGQTLLEVVKLRGEHNASLRFYAMGSLGELGTAKPDLVTTLINVAVRDADPSSSARRYGSLAGSP